jgi:ribosomal protein S18 acetylase RimI-like enzyme
MFVAPAYRGRGIAVTILRTIEYSAQVAGKRHLVLETGDRQPEAIALYQKAGYTRVPDFGHYRNEPGVVSFGRRIA